MRRFVGCLRCDTEEELRPLNELYSYLGALMKLIEKTRIGRRIIKDMTLPEHLRGGF